MHRTLRYNSLFLGSTIFLFGVLKLFEPFQGWFHTQITESGLPRLSIPLGIAAEISIGLGLLLPTLFRARVGALFGPVIALASVGLVMNMAVATYVHLQPTVPAGVLPLGIKPPVVPLTVMVFAGVNLLQLYRTAAPASRGLPSSGEER